jgi:hypothetical protein
MDILNTLAQVAGTLGLDVVLVAIVVFGTLGLRWIFPKVPESWWITDNTRIPVPVLYALGLGVAIGIGHILIAGLKPDVWLRTALGYPLAGIAAYMLTRKIAPDSSILKPPEVKQ